MLKQHTTLFRRSMIVLDLFMVALSLGAGYLIVDQFEKLFVPATYYWTFLLAIGIWWGCLFHSGIYSSFRLKKYSQILYSVYQSTYLSFFFFASMCYVFKVQYLSRWMVVAGFLIAFVLLVLQKCILLSVLHRMRRDGFNFRYVLVIGTGPRAQKIIERLEAHRELGLKVIGAIDMDKSLVGQTIGGTCKVLGTLDDLPAIMKEQVIDMVLVIVPRSWISGLEEAILYLEQLGVRVDIAIDYFTLSFARFKQTDFLGTPFLSFDPAPDRLIPLLFKRLMDLVVSGLALIILAPVFLVTALIIKVSSPKGPVFFVQKRVSLKGRIFNLYKFRTMVPDAESKLAALQHLNEMSGPAFKMTNDPRIIPGGRLLRKFSVDELPQLWNVFLGDMSLVGARPPTPGEVEKYDAWQRRRLSMRPGITCIWQISGRNQITDFDRWIKLDLDYIDNWSLWLDIKILFKTVPVVLFGVGAK